MDKLFITLESIKTRMGINLDLDVDEALTSAIHAAQFRVEQFLDSKLAEQDHTSVFQLDSESYSGIQPGGLYRLYLASGLVAASPTPVLSYGSVWNIMDNTIPSTDYRFDLIKGVCYVDNKWSDYFVTITYTTGYAKAADLPGWLSEMILAYAPVVLNFSQVTNRNKEAEQGYKTSGDHALAIGAPHVRNVGMVLRPLF